MEFHERRIPFLVLAHLRDLPNNKAGKVIKAYLNYMELQEYDQDLDCETFAFVKLMTIVHGEIDFNERMV